MPYEIKKVRGGFKVQKKGGVLQSNGRKYFSNYPLTKERAEAQLKALYANERQVAWKSQAREEDCRVR